MLIIQINMPSTKQKLQHNKKNKPNYKQNLTQKWKLETKMQFFELEVMKTQKDVELKI
jgi:hypothetical protein